MLNDYYRRILRSTIPSMRSPPTRSPRSAGRIKEFPARKALGPGARDGQRRHPPGVRLLFQADLDLKGARGIPEHAVMEVLVVRLARLAARERRSAVGPIWGPEALGHEAGVTRQRGRRAS